MSTASNTMPPNKQTTATVAAPAAPMPVADNGFGGGLQQEDQLEDSLYELDQLHLQLMSLRSALLRMLGAMKTKPRSREAAFAAYAQAVENCRKEIAGFVESLEKANGTFARANQSQATNPKGIKSWRASEHPDWADMNRKRRRVDQ
ncbi:uncharacterized protein CTHT_0071420 [Thermochaetoides thermophila DSM 1495]|uniref:Mediator of RNA polymerase II transcription subunit 11 n=1 Tax=Chaetomium thermophilum (strain DSM 1495 / CBS 144.50 / IMI 039719) TaxID=759272 RepID=G0SFM9_CHATD|nr:hypothetical protein CTHT_0071420 [Thermochaetoides thermophila DSM 1495]EGS17794.1 hypothetical protein CTHT_0071420 [Thermochaetoides thermophila DSM 1495]